MEVIGFEAQKIIQRRYSLVLLVGTAILFPAILKILSHLSAVEDQLPEGIFVDNVAFSIINYTQTYFFIPLWIIVFVGNELAHGHVNRVVFCRSRRFYFLAKIAYCGIITLFFSCIGLITLLIAIKTSPYASLLIPSFFYQDFFAQLFLSSLSFSLLILCLVFVLRSALKTFIVYFIWSVVEDIAFTVFDKLFHIQLSWLPLHLVRSFYSINGKVDLDSYYHPLREDMLQVVPAIGFILVVTVLSYKAFLKCDLPVLSD